MNPLFFGTGARRLFGVYAPGSAGTLTARAAVICYPWGPEYLRAHRSMKHLSTRLARSGLHGLRFDYFGTGDSAGEMTEGDLRGWEDDVETAIDEVKDMTGAERVALIGLRLGGTLAARVATRRSGDVGDVVLWDPIVDGRAYVRSLLLMNAGLGLPRKPADSRELVGFAVSDRFIEELEAIDLSAALRAMPARSLVLLTDEPALRDAGASTVEHVESPSAWVEHRSTGVGAIPVRAIDRVVDWLE